ncbi:MAG: chlororespiratory reduction protein 7 [Oscillatoriaceae bacterium SKW80]|nr:chlororespiratory reduction protein 7 [Oscillatoriaceae bacterium SKYG93]MCX8119720.1 chlororespiratory reduction protein 7 [Oscillatoriaceae bacterium SKW80]MDW8452403.1 chlororespiratory reduction protein 7 [Oscillatoriaceae cyanobacterium SKYGB_i_bin93]HIK27624.1 chlororespiratory reduction protein 7 [Oscillatoriaceae cyanobacterium M7585_C2015_266]
MSDPLMYQEDHFVVLETNQPEKFLTRDEMLKKLELILSDRQNDLPRDLQKFPSPAEQAKYLLDTSCDLDLGPGQFLQWYAVRLEK